MSARSYTRRQLMVDAKRRIPSPYREVEYINNTGSAYLNLGVRGKSNTRLIVDFMFTSVGSTSARPFVQNEDANWSYTTQSVAFIIDTFASNSIRTTYGRRNYNQIVSRTLVSSNRTNKRYVIEIGFLGIYVNGIKVIDVDAALEQWTTQVTSDNIKLFNTGGTQKGYLYGYKLYEGDTMLADAVPCIDANGVAGVYNLVDKTFESSASTTAFIAGKVIY